MYVNFNSLPDKLNENTWFTEESDFINEIEIDLSKFKNLKVNQSFYVTIHSKISSSYKLEVLEKGSKYIQFDEKESGILKKGDISIFYLNSIMMKTKLHFNLISETGKANILVKTCSTIGECIFSNKDFENAAINSQINILQNEKSCKTHDTNFLLKVWHYFFKSYSKCLYAIGIIGISKIESLTHFSFYVTYEHGGNIVLRENSLIRYELNEGKIKYFIFENLDENASNINFQITSISGKIITFR